MAMKDFGIRSLDPRDRAAVFRLAQNLESWFNAGGLAQMHRDLEVHAGLVAVDDGRVLGFLTWHRSGEETANLSWMGVAQEFHRKGVGRALIRVLRSRLRSEGYRFLDVCTVADSLDDEPYANTRKFYRATGFRDHQIDPQFYGEGDDRYDRLVLRLDLGSAQAME